MSGVEPRPDEHPGRWWSGMAVWACADVLALAFSYLALRADREDALVAIVVVLAYGLALPVAATAIGAAVALVERRGVAGLLFAFGSGCIGGALATVASVGAFLAWYPAGFICVIALPLLWGLWEPAIRGDRRPGAA